MNSHRILAFQQSQGLSNDLLNEISGASNIRMPTQHCTGHGTYYHDNPNGDRDVDFTHDYS